MFPSVSFKTWNGLEGWLREACVAPLSFVAFYLMNNCPKCNASVSDDDTECPACGIFFSKWREREDNVQKGNLSKYSTLANATSSEFNWTILFLVCAAIAGAFFFLAQRATD